MISHEPYIRRCFDLATLGGKHTKSNPNVGSVVVYDDKIIGEGYHKMFGDAHAEVEAVNSVVDKSLLPYSTIYVSLEPCCISGKTPPCTDLILMSGIKKVVFSVSDPNPKVSGNSVKILRENGVEVIENVLKEVGESIIRPFIANLSKRPYIILKQVTSLDGFIGHKEKQVWLSSKATSYLTHRWRSEVDAILIGKNTALIDNPSLTTRYWDGENAIRVVFDSKLELDSNLSVMIGNAKTIIVNEIKEGDFGNLCYLKIPKGNLDDLLTSLFAKGICRLLVEGGGQVIESFYHARLWDEYRLIETKKILNNEYPQDDLVVASKLNGTLVKEYTLLDDKIAIGIPK
jgi:diaminohydroxyphosphoribosylaminopyrimidine deaminase / 5-amino-6-(5-phosphoribosylamino)uracil reductase